MGQIGAGDGTDRPTELELVAAGGAGLVLGVVRIHAESSRSAHTARPP